jgi:hypothetical protein
MLTSSFSVRTEESTFTTNGSGARSMREIPEVGMFSTLDANSHRANISRVNSQTSSEFQGNNSSLPSSPFATILKPDPSFAESHKPRPQAACSSQSQQGNGGNDSIDPTGKISDINWYFQLQDPIVRREFKYFHRKQHLPYSFQCVVLFITFILSPCSLIGTVNIFRDNQTLHSVRALSMVIDIILIALNIVGWNIYKQYSPGLQLGILRVKRSLLHSLEQSIGWCNQQWKEDLIDAQKRVSVEILEVNANPDRFETASIKQCRCKVMPFPSGATAGHTSGPTSATVSVDDKMSKEHANNTDQPETNAVEAEDPPIQCEHVFVTLLQIFAILCVLQNVFFYRDGLLGPSWSHSSIELIRFHSIHITVSYLDSYLIGSFLLLCTMPYLLFATWTDISIRCVWILYVITVLFEFCLVMSLHAYLTLPLMLFVLVWFEVMVIDLQLQKIRIFLTTKKMSEMLDNQERMTILRDAQEMRHMIANVAHDLKTVSVCLRVKFSFNV